MAIRTTALAAALALTATAGMALPASASTYEGHAYRMAHHQTWARNHAYRVGYAQGFRDGHLAAAGVVTGRSAYVDPGYAAAPVVAPGGGVFGNGGLLGTGVFGGNGVLGTGVLDGQGALGLGILGL